MRTIFTVAFAERHGGSENVLLTLLRNLDRSEVAPEVIFLGEGGFREEVAALRIPTYSVPKARLRNVRRALDTSATLGAVFRHRAPHLIVNWSTKMQLLGAPAATLAARGSRIVWWQHDFPNGRLADRAATALPAAAVVAVSRAVQVEQAELWPHRRCLAILPGIEPPTELVPEHRRALREQLGIPQGRIVVGLPGRLMRWKGQHRLLEAVALLRQRGSDVHALLVGGNAQNLEPGYEEELRHLARRPDLGGAVTFTGQVEDATRLIQAMDVCVNASDPEPFGLVVLEALATGVPVVAVDAGGPREIIERGRSGILAQSGNPDDLVQAIEPLVGDPLLRHRLADGGRARYRSRFTAKRMASEAGQRLAELTARTRRTN